MALPINATIPACPTNITSWTDPTLVENLQKIRAIHMTELREAVNRERTRRRENPSTFTDDLVPNITKIRKVHLDELRDSIYGCAASANCRTDTVPSPAWTDPIITAKITKVRNDHVQEMRGVVNAMETVCVCDCNYCSCNCNCTCHCCTCDCNHSHRW